MDVYKDNIEHQFVYLDDKELKELLDYIRELPKEFTDEDLEKGRNTSWKRLLIKFETYYKKCREDNIPVTMAGVARKFGVVRATLSTWSAKRSHQGQLVDMIKLLVEEQILISGLKNQTNANISKMVLQALNPEYSDKQDIKMDSSNKVVVTEIQIPVPENED